MVIYVRNCDLWLWSNKGNYAELLVEQKYHPLTQTICVSISHPRRRSGRHKLQSGGHRVNRCFGRVFDPIQGRAGKMKLYNGIFLQGCFKSTVTLLSPVKNLGFLVRSFPSGCGKILLSPQRVVWLGDTGHNGHSQGTARAQPGASNGCDFLVNPGAIFLPA